MNSVGKKETEQINRPDVIYRDGQPSAVILDIDDYREILERLEDIEDLKALEEMRSRPLKFRRLDLYLGER